MPSSRKSSSHSRHKSVQFDLKEDSDTISDIAGEVVYIQFSTLFQTQVSIYIGTKITRSSTEKSPRVYLH